MFGELLKTIIEEVTEVAVEVVKAPITVVEKIIDKIEED